MKKSGYTLGVKYLCQGFLFAAEGGIAANPIWPGRVRERKEEVGKRVAFWLVLAAAVFNTASAEEVGLEKIVVTPYRFEEEVNKTAASITQIQPADINNSNAKTVIDLLRTVPGLVVRDWFGNTTKAQVDIRGFGEQAGMNVLVLVDGRRINEVDLSATDWSQIPLNQVERVEVMRGGNSVLYGDNAVSGVINIITKRGAGKPKIETGMKIGSYDMNSQRLSLSGSADELSYWLSGSRESTHGYRNNSFFKSRDFASKLEYGSKENLLIRFASGFHHASFGFPGALFDQHLNAFGRRYSRFGDDRATDKDYYFAAGITKEIPDLEFTTDASFRRKNVLSNFIDANAGWNPILFSQIDTYGLTPRFRLTKKILGLDNNLIFGLDLYRYDYAADTFNTQHQLQDFSDINKDTIGGYFQDELSILDNLALVGGFRYERAGYQFDYHDNSGSYSDVDTDIKPNRKAYNAGVAYNYQENSSLFFNHNRSFRFPATDEYFTWGSLNTELKPQDSKNYEAGLRHQFNPKLKAEASFFLMDIKNELYYNPAGGPFAFGANENYDKTRHQGIEMGFDSKLFDWLGFFAYYTYTKAYFREGVYYDKYVPMVPRHKANAGVRLKLLKDAAFNITANYTGERYFINDQANDYSPLNGYFTLDSNLAYNIRDFNITAAVNNIFDKEYSEYAVYSGGKAYYPSPGRNYCLTLEYKF